MKIRFLLFLILLFSLFIEGNAQSDLNVMRASETLDSINKYYTVEGSPLLRENYPYSEAYRADYLGDGHQGDPNPYAYLWPFSGSLSAYVTYYDQVPNTAILQHIEERVLIGLEKYYDPRIPHGYASYIQGALQSDRFYDDNIWIGIDFIDLFLSTKNKRYLEKAKEVWTFVASGMDDKLGGGG